MADFERAASLDTAQADSLVSEAILAARLGRPTVAASALGRAIVRVPGDWFAHFELGVVEAGLGNRPGARAELDRAHRLDPGQATVTAAAALVAAGRPLSPGAIERQLTAPLNRRLSATGG
jgi:Flp pilus assembly protein TadD